MSSNDAKFTASVFCIDFFLLLFILGVVGLTVLNSERNFWPSLDNILLSSEALWVFGLFYLAFMIIFYFASEYRQEHPYVRFVGLCIIALSSSYLVAAYSIWIGIYQDIRFPSIKYVKLPYFIFHSVVAISAVTLGLTVYAFIAKKVITLGRGAGVIILIAMIITLSFLPYYQPDSWGWAVALGALSMIYGLYLVVNIVRIMGKYEYEIGDEYATGAIYIHFDIILLFILILLAIVCLILWCICALLAGSRESTSTARRESYVLIKRSDLERLL